MEVIGLKNLKKRFSRIISTALVMAIILSLSACGKKDDNQGNQDLDNNQPPVVTEPDNQGNQGNGDIQDSQDSQDSQGSQDSQDSQGENNDNQTTNPTDQTEPTEPTDIVMSSANERLKYILYQARDEESNDYYRADITNENGLLDLLGLSEQDVSEYVISTSMMSVKAYMVAIFKAAEGKDELVVDRLNAYKDSMIKSFEFYLQDQLEVAENAKIFVQNGYIGIIMCEDADEVEKIIVDGLSNIDSIKVDETLKPQMKEKITFGEVYEIANAFKENSEEALKIYNYDYFDQFRFTDVGSGLIVLQSDVDFDYKIYIGFKDKYSDVEYINFVDKNDDSHGINLMTDDLDEFVNSF